jgi:hypothetical protein
MEEERAFKFNDLRNGIVQRPNFTDIGAKQGDQMSLEKNSPKRSTTIFLSKLIN